MKTAAILQTGFSPQLIRATKILRMGALSLATFLREHNNPCLRVSGLPPPVMDASDETVRQILIRRCRAEPPPAHLRALIAELIECVNDDGFLELSDEAARVHEDWLAAAVHYLQEIALPTIIARDIGDYLLLQLAQQPDSAARTAAMDLVRSHLPWLLRKRWDKLPKRRLAAAAPSLETLTMTRPASALSAYTVPDVAYVKARGLWRATAGDGLKIAVGARRQADGTAAQYAAAKEIADAVYARRRWILRVGQLLADKQSGFFGEGRSALRAFSGRQAAEILGVSEALLSHIVADKAAIFSGGGFPLKYLFAKQSMGIAAVVVQEKIKAMIKEESPDRPLSDNALCLQLRRQGVVLARRTVGKHRQTAGFSAAPLRKSFSSFTGARNNSAPKRQTTHLTTIRRKNHAN